MEFVAVLDAVKELSGAAAKATAEAERLKSELAGAEAELTKLKRRRARSAAPESPSPWASARPGAAFSRAAFTGGSGAELSPWAGTGGSKQEQKAAEESKKKAATESEERQRIIKMNRDAKKAKEQGGAAGAPGSLRYLLRESGVGRAAQAAIGVAGGLELAKLAMGYRGMAMLQAIGMRTQIQLRQLFRGVDPMPVVRAVDRLSHVLNASTSTGKALQGIFTRTFNSLFGSIEKGEPYVASLFGGMVLGALYAEGAWLDLRVAMLPVTDALIDLTGTTDEYETVAWAAAGATGALAGYAAVLAAPFVAAAAAIAAVIDQFAKLKKEIADLGGSRIGQKIKYDLGLTSQGEYEKNTLGISSPGAKPGYFGGTRDTGKLFGTVANTLGYLNPVTAIGQVAGAGVGALMGGGSGAGDKGAQTGTALAQGMIAGVDAHGVPLRAAGGRMVDAVDQGARDKGQIHSPSRLMRGRGRQLGEGMELGIDDSADRVQDAADRSLVPNVSGGAGGGKGGAGAGLVIHVHNHWPSSVRERGLEQASEAGTWKAMRAVAAQLGVPLELA